MSFWREAFSDGGQASSSRVLTMIHSLGSLALLASYSHHHNGDIPDIGTLTALGGFATIHYAVNRATTVWQNVKVGNGNTIITNPDIKS